MMADGGFHDHFSGLSGLRHGCTMDVLCMYYGYTMDDMLWIYYGYTMDTLGRGFAWSAGKWIALSAGKWIAWNAEK
jgi:hypothetical protein